MSKSINDPAGTILLSDSPAEASKKVMSATTDSFGEIRFDYKERPGISNLLQMLALLSNKDINAVIDEWQGKNNYGELKKTVSQFVEQFLTNFQTSLNNVDDQSILSKLDACEAILRPIANEQLLKVQKAVGLR